MTKEDEDKARLSIYAKLDEVEKTLKDIEREVSHIDLRHISIIQTMIAATNKLKTKLVEPRRLKP